jgi:argininosuccinate lyase
MKAKRGKARASKLWGGRFSKPTHPLVEAFTASTHYEDRLVPYDIEGSLAHAQMLGKQGIISRAEAAKLVAGLKAVLKAWETGRFSLDAALEDVHANVEARLRQIVGPLAGKLHSGRSRNDQVALDERLYLRDAVLMLGAELVAAQRAFLDLAESQPDAVMPGYTHLQRAQPVLFSHWCLAYVEMLARDELRLRQVYGSLDECPLGAAALAGSTLPLDRRQVASALGFSRISENSLDTVSNRDYLVELAAALSLMMAHLSRLGEEIVLFTSQEFGFFELDDSFATGSSLMPQKKTPDVAELLRGRAGRAFGLLVQLLTMIKGQPLSYNRDMQEDKQGTFETLDMSAACLRILPPFLAAIRPNAARMLEACKEGFLEATDAADFLVRKNLPFRDAHEAAGKAVREAQARHCSLAELPLAVWKRCHPSFDAGVFKAIDLNQVLASRGTYGGTAPAQVRAAMRRARARLKG